ncbi:MAG TPA: hypothetical protein VE076_03540 [Nitrososphaeraceae archaeon]|nr:hypothetical protein [Nitrososphaeraceae archaeon]
MLELQNLILQVLTNESLLFFIVIAIASFFIFWAIVSIPVWISAKILRAKQAKFTRAMLVTAAGPIAYGIVYFISTRLLSSVLSAGNNYYSLSSVNNIIGIAVAFIAWTYIFKKGFETGWIRALAIAISAIIVFVIIGIIIAFVINQFIPHVPVQSPRPTIVPPMPFQQV